MFSLIRGFRRSLAKRIVEDDRYPYGYLASLIQEIASLPGPTVPFLALWTDENGHLEERCIETPTMGLPRGPDTSNSLLLVPPSLTSYSVFRRALYLSLGVFRANPAGAITPIYPDSEENSSDPMPPEEKPIALTAEARRQIEGGTIVDGKITVRRHEHTALIPAARV